MERSADCRPDQRQILRLNSLVYPPPTRNDFVLCLKAAGQPTAGRQGLVPQAALNPRIDALVKQGLLIAQSRLPAGAAPTKSRWMSSQTTMQPHWPRRLPRAFPGRRVAQYYISRYLRRR